MIRNSGALGIYLGCGEPLIGFWPYLRHEKSSGGMSASLLLMARTVIVRFTLNFLRDVQDRHSETLVKGNITMKQKQNKSHTCGINTQMVASHLTSAHPSPTISTWKNPPSTTTPLTSSSVDPRLEFLLHL